MAKLYGGRWRILDGPRLGQGGQSEVFRVIDERNEHQGEFACKPVLNPARHDRFRNEIEAIKRLQHPNIISLIDHSALDDTNQMAERQFLVMPIAKGGDLSKPGRVDLYKGALDGALQVAGQIARGIEAAHAKNVIHQDIKPQNILFTDMGHEVWISDFGICLLREATRNTEGGEIVGPRDFMAPELEGGGKLEVLPAADIYSFGKVIYYMVRGGIVLPRERLSETQYNQIFENGQRFQLLQLLLSKMICPIEARLQKMSEVIRELDKIVAWEQNARLLSVGHAGLAAADQIKRRALEAQRVKFENAAAREKETQVFAAVKESFTAWLRAELTNVAEQLGDGTGLKLEVREPTIPNNENSLRVQISDRVFYCSVGGLELSLEALGDSFGRRHTLQLLLCQERKVTVSIHVGGAIPPEPVLPARDLQLSFLPLYRQTGGREHPRMSQLMGYLSSPGAVGTIRGQLSAPNPGVRGPRSHGPGVQNFRMEVITSFHQGVSQCVPFRVSQWRDGRQAVSVGVSCNIVMPGFLLSLGWSLSWQ